MLRFFANTEGGERGGEATECGTVARGSSRFSRQLVAVGGEKGDGGEKKIYFDKKCKADLYISWIGKERGTRIVV